MPSRVNSYQTPTGPHQAGEPAGGPSPRVPAPQRPRGIWQEQVVNIVLQEEVDGVRGLEGPLQQRQLGQSPEQAGALVGGSVSLTTASLEHHYSFTLKMAKLVPKGNTGREGS